MVFQAAKDITIASIGPIDPASGFSIDSDPFSSGEGEIGNTTRENAMIYCWIKSRLTFIRRVLPASVASVVLLAGLYTSVAADTSPDALPAKPGSAMTNSRLAVLIKRLDLQARGEQGYWQFSVEEHQVTVITDAKADRMRVIVPIARADKLERDVLFRLMQANFDSALDARYAIAKGVVWGTYIHPLAALEEKEFISGVGQVVNLALTFGTSYSSGALIFQGGDSQELQQRRQLIDDLLKKGLEI